MTDDGPAPPRAARSPAAFAAIVGVACGLVGGAAGAWLVARDPGPGAGAPGSLRGDLDRVERESVAARTSVLERVSEILGRLELAEARAAQHGAGADAVAMRRVADELRMLAEVTRNDLRAADVRLGEVERRLDSLGALATGAPPDGPPDPDEEARWVNLASDADPLRRFSALVVLGRERTDRSVRASLEALHDPVEVVAWQAARNLGRFGDRTTARDLAPLLDHASAAVRSAAAESLRALGAPIGDYEPAAPAESRRGAAAAVERWASERD